LNAEEKKMIYFYRLTVTDRVWVPTE